MICSTISVSISSKNSCAPIISTSPSKVSGPIETTASFTNLLSKSQTIFLFYLLVLHWQVAIGSTSATVCTDVLIVIGQKTAVVVCVDANANGAVQVDLGLVHELEHVGLPLRRVADTVGDNVNLGLFFGDAILATERLVRSMIGKTLTY